MLEQDIDEKIVTETEIKAVTKRQPTAEEVEVVNHENAQHEQKKHIAEKNAVKFAKQSQPLEVEPMSAEEMRALIAQSKAGQGDDCLMCGS